MNDQKPAAKTKKEKEDLFGELCDTEYICQSDDAWFEAPLAAVQLALAVLRESETTKEQAIQILVTYGNLEELVLPEDIRNRIGEEHYGVEEWAAIKEDWA